MNRKKYFGFLIGIATLVGSISLIIPDNYPEEIIQYIDMIAIIVLIPVLGIIRMRYIGMTKKDFILSFIPFYGIIHRFRRLFYKDE